MAQSNTSIETKSNTPPFNDLTATEFNTLVDTIDANANDAETRLSTVETSNTSLDNRVTNVENGLIDLPSYSNSTLPTSGNVGELAYNTNIGNIMYFKNGNWYRSDNDEQLFLVEALTFRVKTDNAGTSSGTEFTLPLITGNTYNFTVEWGDGNSDSITTDVPFTHDYGIVGEYDIIISGTVQGFRFNNGGDKDKLLEISNFGNMAFDNDGTDSFYGCSNLVITATDGPDTTACTDMLWHYRDCSSLTSAPLMTFAQSSVRFFAMFLNCSSLTSLPDYDFSISTNNTKFREMLRGCTQLVNADNVTFGPSGTDPRIMFRDCTSLNNVPPSIDWSNAQQMDTVFFNCESLTTIDLGNPTGVTSLSNTFRFCDSLTTLVTFGTASCTNFANAFDGCLSLANFPSFDYSSGTNFTFTWRNMALNSASIDTIMADLVASNVTNQSTNMSGGTSLAFGSWSAQAQADHATLLSRGWTITTN